MAFLLLRQSVSGQRTQIQVQTHKLWDATGHFKPSVAPTAFYPSSTWKKLMKKTPADEENSRSFFLLSHSQTVGGHSATAAEEIVSNSS